MSTVPCSNHGLLQVQVAVRAKKSHCLSGPRSKLLLVHAGIGLLASISKNVKQAKLTAGFGPVARTLHSS